MSHGDTVEALRRLRDLGDPSGRGALRTASASGRCAARGRGGCGEDDAVRVRVRPARPGRVAADGVAATLRSCRARRAGRARLRPEAADPRPLLPPRDLSYYALLGVLSRRTRSRSRAPTTSWRRSSTRTPTSGSSSARTSRRSRPSSRGITLAHDTLTSKQRRAEYDAYSNT